MENNDILRKQMIGKTNAYSQVTEDFKEAFRGFEGVSFEDYVPSENEEEETEDSRYTLIYLDKNKYQFLKIRPDENQIIKISLHCGSGSVEGENWVYVDSRIKSDYISYSIARTAYGVAFSTMPYISDMKVSLSDGYLQCFFTKFENYEGQEINGFIFCGNSNDDTESTKSYISSEEHLRLESFSASSSFGGGNANQTVLLNAVSYTNRLMCRHLFKKFQTENKKFGRTKLNGKFFISGSHFCLEGREE